MKEFLVGVIIFVGLFLLAGSKYAYNPPEIQQEFCNFTGLCGSSFFQQK